MSLARRFLFSVLGFGASVCVFMIIIQLVLKVAVAKAHKSAVKIHLDLAPRPVPMFLNFDALRFPIILPRDVKHDVRVLADRPRFPKLPGVIELA
jgi:hypothetical protein